MRLIKKPDKAEQGRAKPSQALAASEKRNLDEPERDRELQADQGTRRCAHLLVRAPAARSKDGLGAWGGITQWEGRRRAALAQNFEAK